MPLFAPSGLTAVATTGTAGYALVNGTGTILTWTAPNDGAVHRALVFGEVSTTVSETGGIIRVNYTAPDGNTGSPNLDSGNHGVSMAAFTCYMLVVKANTTVTVTQFSALTAGTATLWAEIWAS